MISLYPLPVPKSPSQFQIFVTAVSSWYQALLVCSGCHSKISHAGWLTQCKLTFFGEAWKSQVKVLVRSFFWFADSCLPSCPHLVEGERALGSSSSFEDTNRIVGPHPPDLIATHCPSQTSPPNSVISLGVRVSMHEFWGGTHMHMSRH